MSRHVHQEAGKFAPDVHRCAGDAVTVLTMMALPPLQQLSGEAETDTQPPLQNHKSQLVYIGLLIANGDKALISDAYYLMAAVAYAREKRRQACLSPGETIPSAGGKWRMET
jgi:hypothetical protein